jgi:hypothetical protein
VELVPQGNRATLTVEGRTLSRWLKVRATARQDPSAFAVVTVQVEPRAPEAEAKGGPSEAPRPKAGPAGSKDGGPAVWPTPFSRPGRSRSFNGIAWDPNTNPPSVVALEILDDRARVVRLNLDGSEAVVGPVRLNLDGTEAVVGPVPLNLGESEAVVGPVPPAAGGAWPDPPLLSRSCDSLAVLPGGDVVVADGTHRRICRIDREGVLSVLAGTGSGDFNGDEDEQGRPRPATQAALGCPGGIAVTPGGEVVFADADHHRIRRFRPGGAIETLAGSGQGPSPVDNDLDRRFPATAASLDRPYALAAGPDGRIVFGQVDGGLAILHPDGTLERQPGFRGLATLVSVTTDGEIITWDAHRWLGRITPGGRPERWSESRLPLQALAAVPGGGVLALDRYPTAIWLVDPARDGGRLAARVQAAADAAASGDLARAAAVRAGLVRWAGSVPPPVDAVRGLLRCSRSGTRLPGLFDVLQDLPWKFLQGDYTGQAVRARIALWTLDRNLERREPGLVRRLEGLAAGGTP